jgi:hypothetical protein
LFEGFLLACSWKVVFLGFEVSAGKLRSFNEKQQTSKKSFKTTSKFTIFSSQISQLFVLHYSFPKSQDSSSSHQKDSTIQKSLPHHISKLTEMSFSDRLQLEFDKRSYKTESIPVILKPSSIKKAMKATRSSGTKKAVKVLRQHFHAASQSQ